MNYIMAVVIGFCVLLSGGTAVAASAGDEKGAAGAPALDPQRDAGKTGGSKAEMMKADPENRASLLYIVLIGGVMVVVMKMAIAYGKRKMEEEREVAREKSALEERQKKSQAQG